jgi:hypothetical protein
MVAPLHQATLKYLFWNLQMRNRARQYRLHLVMRLHEALEQGNMHH